MEELAHLILAEERRSLIPDVRVGERLGLSPWSSRPPATPASQSFRPINPPHVSGSIWSNTQYDGSGNTVNAYDGGQGTMIMTSGFQSSSSLGGFPEANEDHESNGSSLSSAINENADYSTAPVENYYQGVRYLQNSKTGSALSIWSSSLTCFTRKCSVRKDLEPIHASKVSHQISAPIRPKNSIPSMAWAYRRRSNLPLTIVCTRAGEHLTIPGKRGSGIMFFNSNDSFWYLDCSGCEM